MVIKYNLYVYIHVRV